MIPTIDAMDGLPDDLNLLRDLDVLLTERHVTRAAKKLGITQSAASARLRRLREAFGDPLLVDARPSMVPTERGLALSIAVREALAQLAESLGKVAPFDPRTSRRRFVLIGADLVEATAVPALLAAFAREAPSMTLEVERPGPDLVTRLGAGKVDLAFVPSFQATPSLRSMLMGEDRLVVLMRAGHPAAGAPLTLDRFLEFPHVLVAPTGAPGSYVDDALAKLGRRRHVAAIVRHFMAAPIIVARTDALLVCPTTVVTAIAGLVPLVQVAPPLELPSYAIVAVWHERAQHDPGHVFLRRLTREALMTGAAGFEVRGVAAP